jgi:hypothetical protein
MKLTLKLNLNKLTPVAIALEIWLNITVLFMIRALVKSIFLSYNLKCDVSQLVGLGEHGSG